MRTRIKICGLTREKDIQAASDCGVDALGLVFYEPSPRSVSVEQAVKLAAVAPGFVSLVGLFVNPDHSFVESVLRQVPLDVLQFHGDETPEFCEQFGRRWIKAIRVKESGDVERAFETFARSSGILVDAWHPEKFGGTGQTFNWDLIPEKRPQPLILAGGLASDNVSAAIERVKPWAVDVSGGVEQAKGLKDAGKISTFVNEVNRVTQVD